MKVQLLTAIRRSKLRLVPAIKLREANYPNKEIVLRYLRLLTPLTAIPVQINPRYKIFLDGSVAPNSKTGAVYREITAFGKYREGIWHLAIKPIGASIKLFRIFIRTPWLLKLLWTKRKMIRQLDLVALQVVIGYAAYKRFFKKNINLIPIIISDLSPVLQMQWGAALSLGRNVIWWQDDYHHYKGFSKEDYMPYRADIAIVLNQKGLETVLKKNPNAQIYRRKRTLVHPLKPIPAICKVGIATNASFQASSDQLHYIDSIRQVLGVDKVYFRLHPNSKLTIKELNASWIEIAPSNELVETFSQKINIVIVGNSAVQLKLLCLGIPVIHVAALDIYHFDRYGYCNLGFCLGFKKGERISLVEVDKFYKNAMISTRLNQFVNVQSLANELSEIDI